LDQQHFLKLSFWLSLAALVFFLLVTSIVIINGGLGGQEPFEYFQNVKPYASALNAAGSPLRQVLFLDTIFILSYASAIGFAIIAFYERNQPVAWFAGLALIGLVILDNWENIILIQSLDLVNANANLTINTILHQVTVSSAKWLTACVLLFSLSFVLPNSSLVEKLLVWGTRVGMAIGVPLFIYNPFETRLIGTAIIGLSMSGGFVLLALVTRARRIAH